MRTASELMLCWYFMEILLCPDYWLIKSKQKWQNNYSLVSGKELSLMWNFVFNKYMEIFLWIFTFDYEYKAIQNMIY